MKKFYLFVAAMVGLLVSYVRAVDVEFISKTFPPFSILENKAQYKPLRFSGRSRYDACSCVTWFHNDTRLSTVTLGGNRIFTYAFDKETETLELIDAFGNEEGALLFKQDALLSSPDGEFLVTCGTLPNNGVNFYKIDKETSTLVKQPFMSLPQHYMFAHGMGFSTDGRYLAIVEYNFTPESVILIYEITKNEDGSYSAQEVCCYDQLPAGVNPKCVKFTQDNKYVVVGFAKKTGDVRIGAFRNYIAVYPFDAEHKVLKAPVCIKENVQGIDVMEDIVFSQDHTILIASDHANDQLVFFSFDPQNGQIIENDSSPRVLKNDLHLLFPHGMSVSSDGKYLVVANYGDDSFNLYKIS